MTKITLRQISRTKALSDLTGLALEARLADLRKAAAARDATRAAIAALLAPRPDPGDAVTVAAQAKADMMYDRWVEKRRAEMNLTLARQTAAWLEQRSGAATAFGRNEILTRLTAQLQARRLMDSKRKT